MQSLQHLHSLILRCFREGSITQTDLAKPKADIGDSEDGVFTFSFKVHNLTSQQLTYSIDTAALSEKIVDEKYFAQHSINYTDNGIEITYSGLEDNKVIVPENGYAEITVTITAQDSFKETVAAAVNGTFIDGFVMLTTEDESSANLTVPFLGFYGNWGDAPVFDSAEYDSEEYHIFPSAVYGTDSLYGGYSLGINLYSNTGINPDRFAISLVGQYPYYSGFTTDTGLLRNAETLTYTVTNKDTGEIVKESVFDQVKKSYYYVSAYTVTWAEAFLSEMPSFNGYNSDGKEVEEGYYTYTVAAKVAGTDTVQEWSFDFCYDSSAPTVDSYEIVGEEGDQTLKIYVSDIHYLSVAALYAESASESLFDYEYDSAVVETDENGMNHFVIEYDLEDLKAELANYDDARQDRVYIALRDYALNADSAAEIIIEHTQPTALTLSVNTLTMTRGQDYQLEATLKPDEATDVNVKWTSSDDSIATVDENGVVTAVSVGTATITAQSVADDGTVNVGVTDSCVITVSEVSDEQGIVLNVNTLTIVEEKTGVLRATTAPSLSDGTITWLSSDETVATVEGGIISALKQGTAIITVTLEKDGKTYSDTCELKVRSKYEDDFVIDENGTLTAYVGRRVNVEIPSSVKKIDDDVFSYMSIESVYIPASVEEIGDRVFYYDYYLGTVTFEDGSDLKKMGDEVFYYCYGLTSIQLPASLEQMGSACFYYAFSISSMDLSETKLTELSTNAFLYCTGLSELKLPDTITKLEDGCLASTTSLYELALPDSIEIIGSGVFSGSRVESFTAPAKLETISTNAFNTSNVSSLNLETAEQLKTIGDRAFYASPISGSVVIPDSVTEFGVGVFTYCAYMKNITIGKNINVLDNVFEECAGLENIYVADGNSSFSSNNGVLCNKDETELIAFPASKLGDENNTYTVPDNVTKISTYAFNRMSQIETVYFNDVEEIGARAFQSSSIAEIADADNLKTIGSFAFYLCGSLDTVALGDSMETIGAYAFGYDPITSLDLGSTKTIETYAFIWCNQLTTLYIPGSVTSIGYRAFLNMWALKYAYIGSGIKDIADQPFYYGNILEAVILSPEIESIETKAFYSFTSPTFYAPKDSLAYNAAEAFVIEDSYGQVAEYYQLAVDVTAVENESSISVTALPSGGIDPQEIKFAEVVDGVETLLQDYSENTVLEGYSASSDNVILRIYVKDVTGLEVYFDYTLSELIQQLYTVTVSETENGTVTTDKESAEAGETITLTVSPNDGYKLKDNLLKANETVVVESNGQYSFTMPNENVTITAEFEPIPVVNKSVLESKLKEANAIASDEYTAESYATLQDVIKAAQTVYEKADATQEEVDAQVAALEKAIAGLEKVVIVVDKTALETKLAVAKSITGDDYTAASYAALEDAIKAAQAVYDDTNATQVDVDAQVTALENAIAGLETENTSADKSTLESIITKANVIKSDGYTSASYAALQDAIKAALAVYGKADATQEEIDAQISALESAIEALVVDLPFTDLEEDGWYLDAIAYVYKNGYMVGKTNTSFVPDEETTRAQFVTVLARVASAMGEDISGYSSDFSDVESEAWYTDYVAWAHANGIVTGYNTTTFGTHDFITREQMAILFVRFAKYMGITVESNKSNDLTDMDDVSDWAVSEVNEAIAAGYISGFEDGLFRPQDTATRAQIAQVITSFMAEMD